MHLLLAALLFLGILTQWLPARWPVAVFQMTVCCLAALVVVRARRGLPAFRLAFVPLAFAVAWGLLQLATGRTVYAFETSNATAQWAVALAAFFVGLGAFRPRPAREWFREAVLWFGCALAALATLQNYTSGGRVFWIFPSGYDAGVMGPFLNRNHYAAFAETVLPLALYYALCRPRGWLLYGGMAAVVYGSVIASGSRAGAVLATLEVVAVPLLLWGRGLSDGARLRALSLPLAALLAVFTAVAGPQALWHRLLESDPYAVRRELAVSTLAMAGDHPWMGTGLGTWATAYPRYAIADFGAIANQAHSDWLQWAAEGGIPLALMMAALLGCAVRPAWRSVWGVGVIAVFLHATVDYPLSRPVLGVWVLVLLSLAMAEEGEEGPLDKMLAK